MLTIIAAAHLVESPRGQKDLAKFAKGLSQSQRRAVGIRRRAGTKRYTAPDQSTFSRMMSQVDVAIVERVLIDWQASIRGPAPKDEIIAMDGKIPAHSGGKNVVTAVTSPSQHYLGCTVTPEGTNEIVAARELCAKLDLDGRLVSLDAIHAQTETSHVIVEAGGDYLYTVKDNQSKLREQIEELVDDPATPFLTPQAMETPRKESLEKRKPIVRTLATVEVSAEKLCHPFAAQAARIHRKRVGRKPESFCLLTSRPPKLNSPPSNGWRKTSITGASRPACTVAWTFPGMRTYAACASASPFTCTRSSAALPIVFAATGSLRKRIR